MKVCCYHGEDAENEKGLSGVHIKVLNYDTGHIDTPNGELETCCNTPGLTPGTPLSKDVLMSVFKLKVLGVLWCMGDHIEKAQELFQCMVVGEKDAIAAETKLFARNLETLVYISTEVALNHEAKSSGVPRTRNISAA